MLVFAFISMFLLSSCVAQEEVCPEIACDVDCEIPTIEIDDKGCEVCLCLPSDVMEPIPDNCPPVACPMDCAPVVELDDNLCEICVCEEGSQFPPSDTTVATAVASTSTTTAASTSTTTIASTSTTTIASTSTTTTELPKPATLVLTSTAQTTVRPQLVKISTTVNVETETTRRLLIQTRAPLPPKDCQYKECPTHCRSPIISADQVGCAICYCAKNDFSCPPVKCPRGCSIHYSKDSNGCTTCRCSSVSHGSTSHRVRTPWINTSYHHNSNYPFSRSGHHQYNVGDYIPKISQPKPYYPSRNFGTIRRTGTSRNTNFQRNAGYSSPNRFRTISSSSRRRTYPSSQSNPTILHVNIGRRNGRPMISYPRVIILQHNRFLFNGARLISGTYSPFVNRRTDNCYQWNGGCQHYCGEITINGYQTIFCKCRAGYRTSSNSLSCNMYKKK